jgi:serine/threonine-protein kinase
VITQDPSPGRTVRRGREVFAIVSLGPEMEVVPDLHGKDLRESRLLLENKKLLLGKILEPDEKEKAEYKGQPEQVIRQVPAAGERVRKGTEIDVVVNIGPEARMSIPCFEGKILDEVRDKIGTAGFALGKVRWVYHDHIPKGEIIRQNPPPGKLVNPGAEVNLDVSAGRAEAIDVPLKQQMINYVIPDGAGTRDVEFKLKDTRGTNSVYRSTHISGDRIDLLVTCWGEAEVEISVNGRVVKRERI